MSTQDDPWPLGGIAVVARPGEDYLEKYRDRQGRIACRQFHPADRKARTPEHWIVGLKFTHYTWDDWRERHQIDVTTYFDGRDLDLVSTSRPE